jgi:hypothetical protein
VEARTFFLVVAPAPKMTVAEMAAVQAALEESSSRVGTEDAPVRFWQGYLLPETARWVGAFEAPSQEEVRLALGIAQVRAGHISEAVAMPLPLAVPATTVDTERYRRP